MSSKTSDYLSHAFYVICILGTVALIVWCIYMYALDEDMTMIQMEKFHTKPDYIYPSISLCASNIFDESKLNDFGVNRTLYQRFLRGEYFTEDIANIAYEDVVYKPTSYLLGIKIYQEIGTNGLQNPDYHYWYNHPQRNKSSPPQWKPSFHVTLFNHWYGYIYECLTVDAPFVLNEHLSWIKIIMKKSFFPTSVRPMSTNDGGLFMLSIGFPGQRLRYSKSRTTWNSEVTNKSYGMKFQVTGIDVIQARNKKSRPCDEAWLEYDKKARRNMITNVGCVPPYWKSQHPDENIQICNNSNALKQLYMDLEWNQHTHPCRRMARLTTDFIEYPTMSHDKEFGTDYKDKYFAVYFYFPKELFKNIVLVRSFDIQTLIGNAGGYIGLFLGNTLLQLPGFVYYLWKKLKYIFKSENRKRQIGHKNGKLDENPIRGESQIEA